MYIHETQQGKNTKKINGLQHTLKLISSIPKKNSAFCMKMSYFMNK